MNAYCWGLRKASSAVQRARGSDVARSIAGDIRLEGSFLQPYQFSSRMHQNLFCVSSSLQFPADTPEQLWELGRWALLT